MDIKEVQTEIKTNLKEVDFDKYFKQAIKWVLNFSKPSILSDNDILFLNRNLVISETANLIYIEASKDLYMNFSYKVFYLNKIREKATRKLSALLKEVKQ